MNLKLKPTKMEELQMNLSTLTYEALQSIAKGLGLPTELEHATLLQVVTAMLNQTAKPNTESTPAPAQDAMSAVFATPQPQSRPRENGLPRTTGFVSPKLLQFCVDLYDRFGLDKAELDGADYNLIRRKVDELQNRPSPKQMETIHNLIGEINELGVELVIEQEVLDGLTGGQNGTASQLMTILFDKRREAQLHGPLSDKQAETLVKWFYCPDIPWENFDVKQKVELNIADKPGAWRFMDTDEFTAELKGKITMAQAGDFIREHSHLFYEWESTRIKGWQVERIRTLEERMANLHTQGVAEMAIVDGKVTRIYKKPVRKYNPQGYVPMTEAQLKQLSTEDADKLIERMNAELNRPTRGTLDQSDAQDRFESKVHGDPRDSRGGSAELRAVNKEHQAVIDFIFGLEAVVGQENEELHESVTELMIQRTGDGLEVANQLREFIEFALDNKAITMHGLVSMGAESQTVCRLLQIIDANGYDSALHGRKDDSEPTVTSAQKKTEDFLKTFK